MNAVYEIGPFRLDAQAKVVTHGGMPVALGPRAVAVLALLVESAPEYVLKTRLIEAAWAGVVVEEANLAVQISAIRRVLAQTPGGEHWIETLARRGYRFVGPVTERRESPARGAASQRSNLLEPTTSFVGRERELVEIKRALPRTRLLTLIGVGGIGKTRLALRVAIEVMDAYPDGAWLVELAALEDPGLVPQTVATVFGLKEQPGKPLTSTLIEHLGSRQLLLVLDNAEHLRAACAQLADAVLLRCPHVMMLVTSREALGMAGEPTYRVPSLSMPDAQKDATAANLSAYESVQLFIERARLNVPHFAITDQNAPALASVCQRLDGIPLAIELAAARMRSMAVEDVNRRLDQRFRVLTGGSRTAVRRHQTLRAAIDWSYDLLSDAEKALLCRASIFSGGWTLEAAEQACVGDGIDDWEVLDLLTALTDKSLVVAEEHRGTTRYRLLETVRQYAQELLRESGEEAHWKGRHLAYFLELAEEAEPQLMGADQQAWLQRLETEHDNLRSALAWSCTAYGDAVGGLRLAGTLVEFWFMRGYLGEGRAWLSGVLAATSSEHSAARAKALGGAGELARQQGNFAVAQALHEECLIIQRAMGSQRDVARSLSNLGIVAYAQGNYPVARALHEESLALRRELGDRRGMAASLNNLGLVASDRGEYLAARALFEECLATARQLGDQRGIAATLNNLGRVAREQGDYQCARALHEEGLALQRESNDPAGIASSLTHLAAVAFDRGDYPAAQALDEESLAISRDLGDTRIIAAALTNLGRAACEQGEYPTARAFLEEGLSIRRESGDQTGIAGTLEALASVALAVAGPGRAARIWGGAERLREEIGGPLGPVYGPRYDRQVAAARAAMDDDIAFDRAWQEGRAMTLEQAVAYALDKKDASQDEGTS